MSPFHEIAISVDQWRKIADWAEEYGELKLCDNIRHTIGDYHEIMEDRLSKLKD